jgi:hypothetical protein
MGMPMGAWFLVPEQSIPNGLAVALCRAVE